MRSAVLLTFQHRAGVSPYTSSYDFAWTCVFSKQSLLASLCGHTTLPEQVGSRHTAPLLPKLRGHFAEFLNHSSPERLSILYLTTCVGLGYVHLEHSLEAFLGSIGPLTSPQSATHHVSGYMSSGFAYHSPYTLTPVNPLTGGATFLRHPIA